MKHLAVVIILTTLAIFIQVCNGHYDALSNNLNVECPKSREQKSAQYVPTTGQPWPQPQLLTNYQNDYVIVRPALFRFEITRNTCDLIEEALKRYYRIILNSNSVKIAPASVRQNKTGRSHSPPWKSSKDFHGYLDVVNIDLMGKCETYPHDTMDESYEIKIDTPDMPGEGLITASSNWGILRGLETFSQLLFPSVDFTSLQVRSTLIVDYPRFPFRSILLDTSRHFISKKTILANLDLMAMNKYNVFHWHIVDDQSFPYQSKTFPGLSDKGAYHAYTHVYTQKEIAEVIEYGRVRGIRVVPEFDSPGHTQSWGLSQPGLLTKCYKNGKPDGTYGPIDPIQEKNYDFLTKLFEEISTVFPDKFIHLGGDEVDFGCWKSNPKIIDYMRQQNTTDYSKLEGYYMQRLVDIVENLPKKNSYLVWQEVVDNGVNVNNATIVHIWKGGWQYAQNELARVTSMGYRVLVSACWYLNFIAYGIDWEKFYVCDPQDFNGTEAQKRLVLGGGAAMWSEYVDSTNLIPRLWPRAALPAERLWSNMAVNNTHAAAPRLEEHRCRLLKRGYQVEPANGPGFCLVSWDD